MPMVPHHHDFKASSDVIRPAGRVTRFMARVDAHLPTLADDAARRAFLDLQLEAGLLDGLSHRRDDSGVGWAKARCSVFTRGQKSRTRRAHTGSLHQAIFAHPTRP
jgi:hypothetical protein